MSEIPDNQSGRSQDSRYESDDQVDVSYEAGAPIRVSGLVRQISRKRLWLELRAALGKDTEIRVSFHGKLIIFGEVRHCKSDGDGFLVEVAIQDMLRPSSSSDQHLHDDALFLYLAGRGLAVPDLISLQEHLKKCEECRNRLDQLAPSP